MVWHVAACAIFGQCGLRCLPVAEGAAMSEMYSTVRGTVRNDEYYMTGDVKTTVKSKEEIEAYLQDRWPGQIEPVRGPIRRIASTQRTSGGKKRWHIKLPGSKPK